MPLAFGTRLGPYEIQSPLGAGGMGEVYRARDIRLDRMIAIKILPEHFSRKLEAKQRFEREARAISGLIIPIFVISMTSDRRTASAIWSWSTWKEKLLLIGCAMVRCLLRRCSKFTADICEGLEQAHRNGIVHRDLKPANIMLTKTRAKLMDFGLAKPVLPADASGWALTRSLSTPDQPVTAEGTIVGTFQYMSPEQVEGKDADARSDIFSLGCLLYKMITGKRAFQGKTPASAIAAILTFEPESITSLQPMSPAELDRVVKTCLNKDPDDRFQTVHDLKLQLRWLAELPKSPVAFRGQCSRKTQILIFTLSGLLLLALVLLAITSFRRAGSTRSMARAAILPPADAEFFSLDIEAGAPAISTDGKLLAATVRSKNGKVAIWVRALDSLDGRMLPGTEGGGLPFWSPDGRSIGFFANGKLKRIDADGGSLQTICDVSLAPRGGNWNRKGLILFTPDLTSPLYQVPANGGTAVAVTALDGNHGEKAIAGRNSFQMGRTSCFLVGVSTGNIWEFTWVR